MTYLEMKLLTEALNDHARKPKDQHTKECCDEAREWGKKVIGGRFAEEKPQVPAQPSKGYPASQKQIDYVRACLAQRDVASYWRERAQAFLTADFQAWGEAKTLLNILTKMPKLARDTSVIEESAHEYSASPRQIDWCKTLVQTKVGGELFEEWDLDRLTSAQARRIIDALKDAPKHRDEELTSKHFPAGQGIYKLGDEYYMVQVAIHGTGRLMCKQFREGTGYFTRVGGMGNGQLNADNKLTNEEAYAYLGGFAQLYGHCMACGRALTDSESKQYRLGPICRDKAGL